jgi:hypothetical protein
MKHLLTDKFFLKLSLALIIGIISCEFLPIYLGLFIPISLNLFPSPAIGINIFI